MSLKMKKLSQNQQGFITLIICLVAILAAVIIFTYLRVAKASK